MRIDTRSLPGADTTPPDTAITAGPPGKTRSKSASFEFSGSDARAVGSFECRLDNGSFQPCTSPFQVKVKKGRHEIAVRAIDSAGNIDPSPATRSWKVKKRKRKKK